MSPSHYRSARKTPIELKLMLLTSPMPFYQPPTDRICHYPGLILRFQAACPVVAPAAAMAPVDSALFPFKSPPLRFYARFWGEPRPSQIRIALCAWLGYMQRINAFAEIVADTDDEAMLSAKMKYGPGLWVMLTVVLESIV